MNLFPLCHQMLGLYECANLLFFTVKPILYVWTLEVFHLYILNIGLGLASRLVVCLCLKSDFRWAQSKENEYENSPIVWDPAHTSFYTGKLKHSTERNRTKTYLWLEGDFRYCFKMTYSSITLHQFHPTNCFMQHFSSYHSLCILLNSNVGK